MLVFLELELLSSQSELEIFYFTIRLIKLFIFELYYWNDLEFFKFTIMLWDILFWLLKDFNFIVFSLKVKI